MKLISLVLACLGSIASLPAAWTVTAPGGNVTLTLSLTTAGAPRYQVSHHGRPVVLESALGFEARDPAKHLLDGFTVVTTRERTADTTWTPPYGERATIRDHFRERTVELRQATSGNRLTLVVRAYDEGVALRYEFPGAADGSPQEFTAERTEFRFPADAFGYEEHGTEGEYARVPIAAIKRECERPLTVEFADGRFACLVEAALERYPRMLLSPSAATPGALVSALSGPATIPASGVSPWRALIVGDRAGDLLERNTLVANLNPPSALPDTTWIKPGKAIREVTLSTKGGKACIDFAVAHGLSYILYDAGWYGHEYDDNADARSVNLDPKRVGGIPNHGGLDLAEVIAYGRARGIGVFLYVNRRALERQSAELFPLYQKWGVAGVKFGFVKVGPQEWTTWVHDAVRQAAAHQLMVDIHDNYRPTGFTRTYPNLLTQEGVRGNEHMPTATHNTTLPFTRFPAGPADYTICVFDPRVKTTRAHQLALAVVVYSPLQLLYWYDKPSSHEGGKEFEFFDRVPTVWDDTRVIDGRIGEFVTIARRSVEDWYVGTLTNDTARERDIPLGFLPAGKTFSAHVYENGATKNAVALRRETVTAASVLKARLPVAGGQAVWLTPLK